MPVWYRPKPDRFPPVWWTLNATPTPCALFGPAWRLFSFLEAVSWAFWQRQRRLPSVSCSGRGLATCRLSISAKQSGRVRGGNTCWKWHQTPEWNRKGMQAFFFFWNIMHASIRWMDFSSWSGFSCRHGVPIPAFHAWSRELLIFSHQFCPRPPQEFLPFYKNSRSS